ncbi:MAG: acyl-CoA dehydrogenase [Chloroflexi bacterium]|nr:acyl-CoA dehydrogenase [Chloroflexi bacterium CFX1]MCK6566372.1 acyl-CoA dehydrogenase family protein [Anaerolineales bacterium]MCQ3953007.1 acyl-CoA dehydrogenase [Chloroflexota bacterium]MDL1920440.1 acyl-CoA dehydrogenase [Chloroflexi bacterium CFX5]RIK51051.1 MAG: acyl-CoA dehydrogenase [Chloroflexota bacterium]
MDFDLNEEQKTWKKIVHDFVEKELRPKAREVDETEEFNWEAVRKAGPVGLLGLNIPEEYGGSNVDAISNAIAMEELGWGCGSTALAFTAHNSLGCAPVSQFGSEELKKKWLPVVVSGKNKLGSLALTEPGTGSDLQGGVTTRAVKDGDEWVINGAKMWNTNAGIAEYIVTLVRTDPQGGSKSLSMILVPTDSKGLTIHPAEKKMGLRGSPTHAVTYEDVRVPLGNLIGPEGRGLHQTLAILDSGRLSIGAIAIGLARGAMELAIQYAKERKAFGQSISEFQAIQFKIANMEMEIDLARTYIYKAAWLKDQKRPYSREAAIAKLYATEMAERVCYDAIQIHGGYGYSREYHVERMYRDARLMTIGEGTSEIQRLVIARQVLAG